MGLLARWIQRCARNMDHAVRRARGKGLLPTHNLNTIAFDECTTIL